MKINELHLLVESIEHKRIKWLKVNVAGFAIWNSIRIIDSYILVEQTNPILTGISLLAALIWMISLVQILQLGKQMKENKKLGRILNDELVIANRFKTWRFGLIAVMFTQVIIILSSLIVDIQGMFVAELSLSVGVVSTISAFIYYTTKDDE